MIDDLLDARAAGRRLTLKQADVAFPACPRGPGDLRPVPKYRLVTDFPRFP
jgi:hypothetical protein